MINYVYSYIMFIYTPDLHGNLRNEHELPSALLNFAGSSTAVVTSQDAPLALGPGFHRRK